MSVRLHMMSVYKREYCNEIEKEYKGNIHDYNLSVKYYIEPARKMPNL